MGEILTQLFMVSPFAPIKIAILVLLILYIAFAVIVLRQTNVMTKVVEADVSPTIQLIALIHFLATLFLFGWTIVFL